MSYLITAQAVSQDGTALTMTDGGTIGVSDAIITFDSTNKVCDFNNNIGFTTGNGVLDNSANELILFTVTGSATNFLNVTNAATGSGPILAASGSDTNIDLDIDAKGTGQVNIGSNQTGQVGKIKLFDGSGKGVMIKSGSGLAGDYEYQLPTAYPTSNGQVLASTTGGVMSWADDSGGITYNYSVSASFTAAAGNIYAIGDVSATCAIALPAISSGIDGNEVIVKDIAGKFGTNACTISPNGTNTIDGATSLVLDSDYQAVTLRADNNTGTWGIY